MPRAGASASGIVVLPLPPGLPPPHADRLPNTLADCLDVHDYRLIAEADYGYGTDEHFAGLRRHVETGRWAPLHWHPREALELTRWDEPPHDPGFERRHWRRAFSCAALLRASGEPANQGHLYGQNSSLAGLIDSLDALADMPLAKPRRLLVASLAEPAAACLAWLIPRAASDEAGEAAFFGLGLLWFALALDVPDAALVALADWLMAVEDEAASPWRAGIGAGMPGRWLLDGTCFDQRHALWREIGRRLPLRLRRRHGPAVAEVVELIAAVVGDGRRA